MENKKVLEENKNEYEIEEYFTDFNNINEKDDETENFDLVCGIRIECYYVGGIIEQLNLYDIYKDSTYNLDNGEIEIRDITKDEVVIRTENKIQLNKVQARPTEEENKVDFALKVNEFITGYSTLPIPCRVEYKIKVLYVRKKESLEY